MKKCIECKVEKDNNDFYKNRAKCKSCVISYQRLFQDKNKDKIKAQRKLYITNNRSKISSKSQQYYAENKEHISNVQKEYNIKNKNKRATYNKLWSSLNKDKRKKYVYRWHLKNKQYMLSNRSKYEKCRKASDPLYKLRMNISVSISGALSKLGSSKNNISCMKFLPYTIDVLKEYIETLFEPWMTWDNHGKYNSKTWNDNDQKTWTWQIDHIIPKSKLLYISMQDDNFQKCWALENLRPLSAKQNILDGNRR